MCNCCAVSLSPYVLQVCAASILSLARIDTRGCRPHRRRTGSTRFAVFASVYCVGMLCNVSVVLCAVVCYGASSGAASSSVTTWLPRTLGRARTRRTDIFDRVRRLRAREHASRPSPGPCSFLSPPDCLSLSPLRSLSSSPAVLVVVSKRAHVVCSQ